jgi:hypothetical protein
MHSEVLYYIILSVTIFIKYKENIEGAMWMSKK